MFQTAKHEDIRSVNVTFKVWSTIVWELLYKIRILTSILQAPFQVFIYLLRESAELRTNVSLSVSLCLSQRLNRAVVLAQALVQIRRTVEQPPWVREHMYTHIHTTTCTGILAVHMQILCAAAYSAVQSCKRPILHYTNILFTQVNLHTWLQTHTHTLNLSLYLCPVHVTLLPTFPCFNRDSLKGQHFIMHHVGIKV